MPKAWTDAENNERKVLLVELYLQRNLTIKEIGKLLSIHQSTVYGQLTKLGIETNPAQKPGFTNANLHTLPEPSIKTAEFFGIMWGDGHLTQAQCFITLNFIEESQYILYVSNLILRLFGQRPSYCHRTSVDKAIDIFITGVRTVAHLNTLGLTSHNKILDPPILPSWIRDNSDYRKAFIRGIFDTDGSVYSVNSNYIQLSFTNLAPSVLEQLRDLLIREGFRPSRIGKYRIYLTRQKDITRYFQEIGSANRKHVLRHAFLGRQYAGVWEAVKPSRL